MGVVLWIILILIGIAVGVASVVALCPIHVRLAAGSGATRFGIRYLCFDIGIDNTTRTTTIKIFGMTVVQHISTETPEEKALKKEREKAKKQAKEAKKQQKTAKKRAKKRKMTPGNMWEVMQDHPKTIRKWLEQIVLLVYRIITASRIDRMRADVVIATPDPYWTGMIAGAAEALRGNLLWLPRVSINVRPDFETDRPSCTVSLSTTYRMWRLTWAVVRFLCAVPKIEMFKIIRAIG
jgi:hypothetical protein